MSMLTRWNPFKPAHASTGLLPGVDELLRNMWSRPLMRESDLVPDIRIEVNEDDKAYRVSAEIPGVDKKDISITVDGNEVTISAEVKRETDADEKAQVYSERSFGRSYRAFTLPVAVDEAKADAKYENGVLTLSLPKKANGQRKAISIS